MLILRKRNPEYPRKKWLTLGGIPQIIGILGNVYMIWNISTKMFMETLPCQDLFF